MLDTASLVASRLNQMFGTPSAEEYTARTMQQLIAEKVRSTPTAISTHIGAPCDTCRGATTYADLCMQGKLAITMDAGALGISVKQFLKEPL